jgi:hypothetical protein
LRAGTSAASVALLDGAGTTTVETAALAGLGEDRRTRSWASGQGDTEGGLPALDRRATQRLSSWVRPVAVTVNLAAVVPLLIIR